MESVNIKSESKYEIKFYKEGLKEYFNVYKIKQGYFWVTSSRLNLTDNIYYIKITTEACESKYYLQLFTKTLQSNATLESTKAGSCWFKIDVSKNKKIEIISSNHEIIELEMGIYD